MAYVKHCELCTDKCPQAERAHEAAAGRMYATKEFIVLQKKVENGQLVEVVRCQDCRFYIQPCSYTGRGTSVCTKYNQGLSCPKPDDFCSYGERRCE